jgi:ABC-type ATPase involved in cell division
VLIATHDLRHIQRLKLRCLTLKDGAIVQDSAA